jgi:adenosylmethionine-8-amino-7-oxononanoate aminotransferase
MYNHNYVLPYTNHSNLEPLVITSAQDFHLITKSGERILDAQCGNINCNLGYSQHTISESIYKASLNLPFSRHNNGMLAEIGDNYSKRLSSYFPHHNKFFFGSSGSDAVETALRLSYMVRLKEKSRKTKIVTVRGSYHGSTWLTGAISDLGGLGQHLPEWPEGIKITSPFGCDGSITLSDLNALDANEISSIVIEPFTYLSGVLESSKEFWIALEKWCCENDVHLILDESASGFFKTGKPFYHNKIGIVPTFVCMTKSITAGYAPLSAVAILNHSWNIIKDDWIVHGWTNSGSIIGLAAADEALNLFENNSYNNESLILEFLEWLKTEHEITSTRNVGNFFAFEMKSRKWRRDVGVRFANVALKHNLQLTTFKYDAVARGLIPLNATESYFEELKEKVSLVVNDKDLLRSSIVN